MANVSLREWTSVTPEDCAELAGRRLAPGGSAWRLAQALTAGGRLTVRELADGLTLQATSWVGRITLDDLTITVRPKIPALPLMTLLRYAYGLRDLHLMETAGYAGEAGAFQDLLIAQLIAEASDLLARGLHSDYRRTAEVLEQPRGRIDLRAYAAGAGHARAALPCVHYPRTSDVPLNRALLAGLLFASGATRDVDLRTRLHRLAARLDDVLTGSRGILPGLDSDVLARAYRTLDRRTVHYRPALTLIDLLLRGMALSFDDPRSDLQLDGMLFDMNAFFQALLSRFLRAHLADARLVDEHRLRGVFAYDPRRNPRNRRDPAPRPDFAVVRESRVIALLDAKYRDLWEQSLPREMLYQLAIYALTQPGENPVSIILYPSVTEAAQDQVVEFRGALDGIAKASVILRPVHLLRLNGLLRAGSGVEAERGRQAMVASLIRGVG
jgi:5-methylcytosine-specific restriction enzyme subunit McrC